MCVCVCVCLVTDRRFVPDSPLSANGKKQKKREERRALKALKQTQRQFWLCWHTLGIKQTETSVNPFLSSFLLYNS